MLATLAAVTTVGKAEAMVLSWGTKMASTLPVITDMVVVISLVDGTAYSTTVKPASSAYWVNSLTWETELSSLLA